MGGERGEEEEERGGEHMLKLTHKLRLELSGLRTSDTGHRTVLGAAGRGGIDAGRA